MIPFLSLKTRNEVSGDIYVICEVPSALTHLGQVGGTF